MSQGNNTKLVFALLMLGAIATYMAKAKKKPLYTIPYDDFDGNNYENLSGEEQELLERFFTIKDIEPGSKEENMTYGNPIPPPTEGEALGELINFNITNNTNSEIPIVSILGNNQDRMDTANATTSYAWDITNFTFTNETQVLVNYRWANSPSLSPYQQVVATILTQNLEGLINALNTLELGCFFISTTPTNTYLNNYNQNVVFGDLTILNDSFINTTFVVGTGFNSVAGSQGNEAFALQSDGKIIVGGTFTSYQGTTANRIVRINTNGSIDATFNTGTGFNNITSAISLQSDGKIIVGGTFTSFNGIGANRIVRLNTDGSIDATFVYGTGFDNFVNTTEIQSDGKILVGGTFTSYNGTSANRIIRLNTDGSVDGTFVYGTGFNSTISDIATQNDGKILIIGGFTTYNGIARNRIIRLDTNGNVDGTFLIGTGFNAFPNSISIQSDGNLVIVGGFTSYNGTNANRIIRLTTLGAVDTSFNYGIGFDNVGNSIAIQSDGKIVIVGQFTTYQGTSANYIVRLLSTGAIDTSFNYGTGFNGQTLTIGLGSSQMYIMGSFTIFNGQSYNYIVSLIQ